MSVLKTILPVLCCVFLLCGCYEDESEITLNDDGSGFIKGRLVISERLIVATLEDGGNENMPAVSKEKVLEEIGSAIDINSITHIEMPDGGRIIEYEGTFSSAEQFFLSEFCRETLKLRLASAGDGKAVIYCDVSQSSGNGGGPSITQLYGLAKGLYFKRTIHLPAEIEQTNGYLDTDKKTVSWAADLRDKEGLAKTKEFVEGKDKGIGSVVFDSSELEFSLPLKADVLSEGIVTSETKELSKKPSDLNAKVSWVTVNKKMEIDSNSTEPTIENVELGIMVSWNEANSPFACHTPVLINVQDEFNNDLVKSAYQSTFRIRGSRTNQELKIKTKTPSENVKKLKNLEGYVLVIASVETEKVILENMQELVGKQSTGNQVLDKLNFKIKSIQGPQLNIEIDGGRNTITSLVVFEKDGSKVSRRGGMGGGNSYSYDFAADISKLSKCELEVIVSQNLVKVPFSLDEIVLP